MIAYWFVFRQSWFRVFGWGVYWADHRIYQPLFSERTDRTKVLRVGVWSLRLLRPKRVIV